MWDARDHDPRHAAMPHRREVSRLVEPLLIDLAATHACRRLFLVFVEPDGRTIQACVGANVPADFVDTVGPVLVEGGPVLETLRRGRPLCIADVLRAPEIPDAVRTYYASLGMLSLAVVPLTPPAAVLIAGRAQPFTAVEVNGLLAAAGRVAALIAEQEEVARLRAAAERSAAEREWLWGMISAVQDPVVLSDEGQRIILANPAAERLLRAHPADSPGKRYAVELNNALLLPALAGFAANPGWDAGRELTLVDPVEGEELLFELICRPVTNLRTGERGLVAVLKNVTDLRRAAEEVQHSLSELARAGEEARRERDRLNLILENVADPIVVTDPAGQIILMNQPAERLFQPLRDTASAGANTAYLANDAKLSAFLSQLGLEAATVRRGEVQLQDPDTEDVLTMSATATEVRDALGQVTAVVTVLHDLTKVRELERRTVEHQLAESEKLAAVGRLAAAVAHEINNPLEAIKNALYLLVTRTPEDDPNRAFLEIASRETERVAAIIRQMLGFYRQAPRHQPVDVNHLLREVAALLERQLRRHRVTLALQLSPHLPPVMGSGDQLKQVFLNLFLNAQEAMPTGGALTVTTHLARDGERELLLPGEWIVVQVQDTGVGIPEEHQRHIFEPFFSTKREQKGTGLGLWVSKGIIQQHGGQMRVRSRPGRGTTFIIALPPGASDG
jgi:PAS domain S-box-containing protein